MIHSPISLRAISLSFSHKICFENFHAQIHYGARIALIGDNGCGKSSLLRMICEQIPHDAHLGFVPQIIEGCDVLSGAERFNKALSHALGNQPNILVLDEPTNHLDQKNRKSLLRFLLHFPGTMMIASHDIELLEIMDTFWHIHHGKIAIFSGRYHDYQQKLNMEAAGVKAAVAQLNAQRRQVHLELMQEQMRAAKSTAKGKKNIQNRKWPTIVSHTKASRGSQTTGQKRAALAEKRAEIMQQRSALFTAEIIKPTFHLMGKTSHEATVLSIGEGQIGYENKVVQKGICLSLRRGQRLGLLGDNGSGKSTLLKAILNTDLRQAGYWHTLGAAHIGYLDQHYCNLNSQLSVLETIQQVLPSLDEKALRNFLSQFLFREHEAVSALVATLSGGEKARLSLALIAAQTPQLLLLDEITNNLDLQTKTHVIEVLRAYPGAMVVVSHDQRFLEALEVDLHYELNFLID